MGDFSVTDDLPRRFKRFNELEAGYERMTQLMDWISAACEAGAGSDKHGKEFKKVALPATANLTEYVRSFGYAMGLTGDTGQGVAKTFDEGENLASDTGRKF